MRINRCTPFREIRYIETEVGKDICKIYLTGGRTESTSESLRELCAKLSNILKEMKEANQIDKNFYFYKVGKRYLLNLDYLACLHPSQGTVIIADHPDCPYDDVTGIGEESLRGFKRLLIPEEQEKFLARRESQATNRRLAKQQKRTMDALATPTAMKYNTVLLGFQIIESDDFYRPSDFDEDVCII